jgi:hypothetical protein
MNSILQQLFHTPAFCYSLLTSKFDGNEAHQAIQDIFAEMVLSQRRFADTEKFAKVWRGWGNIPINPREQQDASEFLHIFLDQFPPTLHSIYRGEIENTIEDIEGGFRSSNSESFYPLQLDIKEYENLSQSFNVFLAPENFTGANRYRTTDGKLIDARKFSRIKSAPAVLVLQLKRFVYDLKHWTRVKVHDRYVFPTNELNIKELLTTNSEDVIYRLTGIVLHSGTAQGGHYTSLIRINNKWIMFNDNEVTGVPDNQIEYKAFGGNESKASAYLLFYTKKDATFTIDNVVYSYDAQINMAQYLNRDVQTRIESDNHEFIQLQTAFSPNLFDFVIALRNQLILLKYYLHIFCHSQGLGDVAQIQKSLTTGPQCFNYIDSQRESIKDILLNCTQAEILESLVAVLNSTLDEVSVELSGKFIDFIIESLLTVPKTSWRQVPFFTLILHHFGQSHRDYMIEKEWLQILVNFVRNVYSPQPSSVALKSINLSCIFMILTLLADAPNAEHMSVLISMASSILKSSSHADHFIPLIFALAENEHLDLDSTLPNLLTVSHDISADLFMQVLTQAIANAKNDSEANLIVSNILSTKKVQPTTIIGNLCSLIKDGTAFLRSFFFKFPSSTLLFLLTREDDRIRTSSQQLASTLFYMIDPPKSFPTVSVHFGAQNPMIIHPPRVWTDDTGQELAELLCAMFHFIEVQVIPNISQYYKKHSTTVNLLGENRFYLLHLLNVLEWYLSVNKNFSLERLSILRRLSASCVAVDFPGDCHIAMVAQIMAKFPKDLVCTEALPTYRIVLRDIASLQDHQICHAFVKLWSLFAVCEKSTWLELVCEPNFARVFQALATSYDRSSKKIVPQLCTFMVPLIPSFDPVRSLLISLLTSHLRKVLEIAAETFNGVFQEVLSFLPQSAIDEYVGFVFRKLELETRSIMYADHQSALLMVLDFGLRLVLRLVNEQRFHVNIDEIPIQMRPAVEGFSYLKEDEFGQMYRNWVLFWARQSTPFYGKIFDTFKAMVVDPTVRHANKLLAQWLRFEAQYSQSSDRLSEIFQSIRDRGDRLAKIFFRFVAERIDMGDVQFVLFAKHLTANIFSDERLATKSAEKVFRAGLSSFEVDDVVAVFAVLADQIVDLTTKEERRVIAKATLIIEAREDLKELLVSLFPIQERETLEKADLLYAANLLFGGDGSGHYAVRIAEDRTSDEDELGPIGECFETANRSG